MEENNGWLTNAPQPSLHACLEEMQAAQELYFSSLVALIKSLDLTIVSNLNKARTLLHYAERLQKTHTALMQELGLDK